MGGAQLSLIITCRHLVVALLIPVAFISFSACRQSPHEQGNVLENRVKGFWEERVAGKEMKAYEYEAYAKRGSMSAEQYLRARNPALKYKSYTIKGIEENGDEATVKVDVAYHLMVPARGQLDSATEITEQWVRLDGQWYRKEAEKNKKPLTQ
jgi:hypothetical protein